MKELLIKLGLKKQSFREIQTTTVFKYEPKQLKKEPLAITRHLEKLL